MNGALCMELLTNEGWNPVNDIESVIVSIRSLLVVGDGRLEAATNMSEKKREALLAAAQCEKKNAAETTSEQPPAKKAKIQDDNEKVNVGAYSTAEAKAAYNHLSEYHKKKGWSGWCKLFESFHFSTSQIFFTHKTISSLQYHRGKEGIEREILFRHYI